MEAGYDYLLLRGRLQRRFFNYAGIFVLLLGAALLATSGAYYGYAANARADLGNLNATLPGALTDTPQAGDRALLVPAETVQGSRSVPAPAAVSGLQETEPGGGPFADTDMAAPADQASAKLVPAFTVADIGSRQLYPGELLVASSWSDPLGYEPPWYREQVLLQGFTPIESLQALPVDGLASATRIIVPAIGVDSKVAELAIKDLRGSRTYETPDNTVGHIPETAEAGEAGSSWFFGHTESPVLGEGSVFFDLRKVPDMLRRGEDVFIITDNGLERYLYRATSTQVVNQDDMTLYDTGRATIHLVSCVPRLVYDHRLVVTAELIGQKTKS